VEGEDLLPEGRLAIRIHLDDCNANNSALRVVPGSHRYGFLSDTKIQQFPKATAATCVAKNGYAMLMRPLLLHSSYPASIPTSRRVVHLEFAAEDLPGGIEWRHRV
jgi:ectoine hydroxylase-related dioxygenase (phytanoyl-CoA dioxygenase family)